MMVLRRRSVFLVLIVLMLVLAGCRPRWVQNEAGRWIDWDGDAGWQASETSSGKSEGLFRSLAGSDSAPIPVSGDDGMMEEEPASEPLEESPAGDIPQQAPNLRAGSVDDNQQWDDYLFYRLQALGQGLQVHDLDVSERHIFRVSDSAGRPVLGAQLTILDAQGQELTRLRSHADGTAMFFSLAQDGEQVESFRARIEKDGREAMIDFDRMTREHPVTLDTQADSEQVRLDVHFLIDATGSMSDEIQQLRDNMITISERINALASAPDVRFGMTVYRDRGDLFVSRSMEFTPDVQSFTDELRQVEADGGGDYPESLNEGLHNALALPEWRVEDTISLVFLVADAPPHLDYQQDYDYADEALAANQRGIKIYPLASSGLDDQGEYIFRQLAQITGGKFLFLTYGAGGVPGDETTHHVDDYSVLSLDQLVVQMVAEELAYLEEG